MNEEIIIDGVDVSGCDRYNDFPCKHGEPYAICLASFEQWNDGEHKYCKDRPDCYYKQLKRLQAENEQLKETCYGLLKIQYALAEESNEYEKALEEIREILKGNKDGDIDEMIDKINEVLNGN